jgi:hypothetical protein
MKYYNAIVDENGSVVYKDDEPTEYVKDHRTASRKASANDLSYVYGFFSADETCVYVGRGRDSKADYTFIRPKSHVEDKEARYGAKLKIRILSCGLSDTEVIAAESICISVLQPVLNGRKENTGCAFPFVIGRSRKASASPCRNHKYYATSNSLQECIRTKMSIYVVRLIKFLLAKVSSKEMLLSDYSRKKPDKVKRPLRISPTTGKRITSNSRDGIPPSTLELEKARRLKNVSTLIHKYRSIKPDPERVILLEKERAQLKLELSAERKRLRSMTI